MSFKENREIIVFNGQFFLISSLSSILVEISCRKVGAFWNCFAPHNFCCFLWFNCSVNLSSLCFLRRLKCVRPCHLCRTTSRFHQKWQSSHQTWIEMFKMTRAGAFHWLIYIFFSTVDCAANRRNTDESEKKIINAPIYGCFFFIFVLFSSLSLRHY